MKSSSSKAIAPLSAEESHAWQVYGWSLLFAVTIVIYSAFADTARGYALALALVLLAVVYIFVRGFAKIDFVGKLSLLGVCVALASPCAIFGALVLPGVTVVSGAVVAIVMIETGFGLAFGVNLLRSLNERS